jgi:hypothetical protein
MRKNPKKKREEEAARNAHSKKILKISDQNPES